MHCVGPEGGGQFCGIPSSPFQILNHVEKLIHRLVLTRRSVLSSKDVDRNSWMNAWQNATLFSGRQRFEHCEGAMLAIVRVSVPPDHGKYLVGAEVVDGAAVPTHLPTDWIPETKAIRP